MGAVFTALALVASPLHANPEATVQLPGGESMDFVWIEAGTFTMGAAPTDPWDFPNETPAHAVAITQGFWLGKYEVTQGQWEAVRATTPWKGRGLVREDPRCPASYVSWGAAYELCERLSAAAGSALYRLPTEAEWEYACRAGTTTIWHHGNDTTLVKQYDWVDANTKLVGMAYPQPVGELLPNPWGLYDMHGNVQEWVQDWYRDYAEAPEIDPAGPVSGTDHVLRGGYFYHFWRYARSSARMVDGSGPGGFTTGVRLLRVAPPPASAVTPAPWGSVKEQRAGH